MNHIDISIQTTNNKNIVKFVASVFLTETQSFEFNNIDEAKESPLAQQLFYLPFVKTVYISQNFIAIEKFNIVEWDEVQDEVALSIKDYLNSGKKVVPETISKKIPVTVYAESTPNPSVMKFVVNKPLVEGVFEFKSIDDTLPSPLARALFSFPFIKEVFISNNYISVTKYDIASWEEITMELREFVRNYLENEKPVLSAPVQEKIDNHKGEKEFSEKKALSSIEEEIVSILNEYVQPAVAGDGGHIAFDSFDESTKTVRVILQGACSGCPSSTFTLKNGIETMLKEMLQGKVSYVEAING